MEDKIYDSTHLQESSHLRTFRSGMGVGMNLGIGNPLSGVTGMSNGLPNPFSSIGGSFNSPLSGMGGHLSTMGSGLSGMPPGLGGMAPGLGGMGSGLTGMSSGLSNMGNYSINGLLSQQSSGVTNQVSSEIQPSSSSSILHNIQPLKYGT